MASNKLVELSQQLLEEQTKFENAQQLYSESCKAFEGYRARIGEQVAQEVMQLTGLSYNGALWLLVDGYWDSKYIDCNFMKCIEWYLGLKKEVESTVGRVIALPQHKYIESHGVYEIGVNKGIIYDDWGAYVRVERGLRIHDTPRNKANKWLKPLHEKSKRGYELTSSVTIRRGEPLLLDEDEIKSDMKEATLQKNDKSEPLFTSEDIDAIFKMLK